MAVGTEIAWRILEIAALALPAFAILVQVMLSVGDENTEILNRYLSITAALFLIAPLSITSLVAVGVILSSYQIYWLPWAAFPMAFSFLLLPVFLIQRWRSKRSLFTDVFLEREKEVIKQEAESGSLSPEEVEEEMNRVKSQQKGLLWNLRNPEKSKPAQRMSRLFAIITIVAGSLLIYNLDDLLTRIFLIFVVLYNIYSLSSWSIIDTVSSTIEQKDEETK